MKKCNFYILVFVFIFMISCKSTTVTTDQSVSNEEYITTPEDGPFHQALYVPDFGPPPFALPEHTMQQEPGPIVQSKFQSNDIYYGCMYSSPEQPWIVALGTTFYNKSWKTYHTAAFDTIYLLAELGEFELFHIARAREYLPEYDLKDMNKPELLKPYIDVNGNPDLKSIKWNNKYLKEYEEHLKRNQEKRDSAAVYLNELKAKIKRRDDLEKEIHGMLVSNNTDSSDIKIQVSVVVNLEDLIYIEYAITKRSDKEVRTYHFSVKGVSESRLPIYIDLLNHIKFKC